MNVKGDGRMRRFVPVWLAVAVLIVMAGFSSVGVGSQLNCLPPPIGSTVNKTPGGVFTVEISFKNTGQTEGTWSVNVAFEDETWTWKGTAQTLTLKADSSKMLVWNGTVPAGAPIDSTARLVVYYSDTHTALDWWIHVVPAAELAITDSTVR